MSISFPKTFVSNEILQAEDVRNNLGAMRDKQQKLTGTDMLLGQSWVDTHHIMQGRYEPVKNISVNVSGVFGGRNNGGFFNNLSYCSRWFSQGTNNNTRRVYIPYTNITFDILRPCTLFFQWSMIHQSLNDADGTVGQTLLHASLNDKAIAGNGVNHIVTEQPNTLNNVLIDGTRTTNGIILKNISNQVLDYSIGLTGQSTAGKCQNVSWSVSLECFYM